MRAVVLFIVLAAATAIEFGADNEYSNVARGVGYKHAQCMQRGVPSGCATNLALEAEQLKMFRAAGMCAMQVMTSPRKDTDYKMKDCQERSRFGQGQCLLRELHQFSMTADNANTWIEQNCNEGASLVDALHQGDYFGLGLVGNSVEMLETTTKNTVKATKTAKKTVANHLKKATKTVKKTVASHLKKAGAAKALKAEISHAKKAALGATYGWLDAHCDPKLMKLKLHQFGSNTWKTTIAGRCHAVALNPHIYNLKAHLAQGKCVWQFEHNYHLRNMRAHQDYLHIQCDHKSTEKTGHCVWKFHNAGIKFVPKAWIQVNCGGIGENVIATPPHISAEAHGHVTRGAYTDSENHITKYDKEMAKELKALKSKWSHKKAGAAMELEQQAPVAPTNDQNSGSAAVGAVTVAGIAMLVLGAFTIKRRNGYSRV